MITGTASIDWNATAAWIALAISITGTILGPIVTSILNNRHQLKIRKMEMLENITSDKNKIFRNCISSIGLVVSFMSETNIDEFGKSFHSVYAYVPSENWQELDSFYLAVIENDYKQARNMCPKIISLLTELLAETH